jgi:hypothetical protein
MNEYEEDRLATPSEACKEYARNYGSDHPERAWILTDFDTWERNPFYSGPKVPHPEDDCYHYGIDESKAEKCQPHYGDEPLDESVEVFEPQERFPPDDIPF